MNEEALDPSSVTGRAADEAHVPLDLLRQAREAVGLHIAALAAALKVPVRKLEALEAGRYEELPDLTFARALASSACRQLKIDPGPVLEQIPMGQLPVLGQAGNAINTPFKASFPGSTASQSPWFFRPSVIIAALLLIGALVLLVLPEVMQLPTLGTRPTTSSDDASQRVEPIQLGPSFREEATNGLPGVTLPNAPAEEGSSPLPSVQPESETPVETAPAAEEASADTSAGVQLAIAPPPSTVLLRISAVDESWVEVTNGAGAVVVQRVLKQGDVIEFSSAPPYRVILGRAEAAQVFVRGQSFDVMPYARNSVARFEVK
jgi:cytoskeleton protein RodZ